MQLGFIIGTLTFALSGLADRFRASRIFVCCALLGATFNVCFAFLSHGLTSAAIFRFLVGVCLAGIYPIGMKLIVSWAPERTGSALAYLVGMLTLGTALPHATRSVAAAWGWQLVIASSSGLAVLGAVLIYSLGDGPHLPGAKRGAGIHVGAILSAFKTPSFRAAALGYFGHMWELYTFWTLVPLLILRTSLSANIHEISAPMLAFLIIAAGAVGCIVGGVLSRKVGSAPVAAVALATSGSAVQRSRWLASTESNRNAGAPARVGGFGGSRLTAIFSAIGESVSAEPRGKRIGDTKLHRIRHHDVSIATATSLFNRLGLTVAWILLPGPVLGLVAFYPLWRARAE